VSDAYDDLMGGKPLPDQDQYGNNIRPLEDDELFYEIEELPIGKNSAYVLYRVTYQYDYDSGTYDTPPHTQADVVDVELVKMTVSDFTHDREGIAANLDNILAGQSPHDYVNREPTMGELKLAIDHFWTSVSDSTDLKDRMIDRARDVGL
jgi:hypothetical protein